MIYAIRVASTTGSFSQIIASPDRAAARCYAAALIRALRLTSAHRRFTVEPIESSAQLDNAKKLDRAQRALAGLISAAYNHHGTSLCDSAALYEAAQHALRELDKLRS